MSNWKPYDQQEILGHVLNLGHDAASLNDRPIQECRRVVNIESGHIRAPPDSIYICVYEIISVARNVCINVTQTATHRR